MMDSKKDTRIDETDDKIETEQNSCLLETKSIEIKSEKELTNDLDFQFKSEWLSATSIQGPDHLTGLKIKIKEERITMNQSEMLHGLCVPIRMEPASIASDFLGPSSSNMHVDDHEVDIKTEIKEEALYLERRFTEVKYKSEKMHLKDADVYFTREDNVSEEDKEINSPESSTLDTEAVWNNEADVPNADLDKDCLKLPKNTSNLEKSNANRCNVCDKTFGRRSSLKRHNLIHEGKRLFKCNLCDKSFTLAAYLKAHHLIHNNGKRPFKCDRCDKRFFRTQDLRKHSLIHEGKRQFKCNICDKSFIQTSHLKAHKLIHQGKRPFKCDKCDKSFTTTSDLKTHNLFHEGKRPFKCDKCDKSFTLSTYLKKHSIIHEGKRPYRCNICDKRFIQSSHLKVHHLIHEGKRPFKCDKCDKSFICSSHLKRHNLIHEGKRPFKCDTCCKTFALSSNLKVHNLIHEGKRLY